MCGIAGFFSQTQKIPTNAKDTLEQMGNVQSHRGPDDAGIYLSTHCGFSFRRLAILDIVKGQQPMISPCQSSVIVFNGEIYNFRELQKELLNIGIACSTNCDTEVILLGYKAWGKEIIYKLRGMFAFAIYDILENSLFIARDHTGIKPFYYSWCNNHFVFASEIKAILQFPGITAKVNTSMLPQYMSFLWVPAPNTLFKDIFTLPPGHTLEISQKQVVQKKYWDINLKIEERKSNWTQILENELQRVVEEQMISDVPLGAFLSGGLDSSTIIYYMNHFNKSAVTTYTTGFSVADLHQDVVGSDLKYARLARKHLKVDYHELILDANVENLLPKLTWHMDEPVSDPAAVATYLICKAAKEKATVMLAGVGADEIFGGYPRYLASFLTDKYQFLPKTLKKHIAKFWLKKAVGSSSFVRNIQKFLKSADLPFEQRYLGYLTYYSHMELKSLFAMDFCCDNIFNTHLKILEQTSQYKSLQRMTYLDLKTFLPQLNLAYTDKMSSAASVEVRVPFLDHILIEKALQIPQSLKIKYGTRKYILKKTMVGKLPRTIIWRKKVGFGAPIGAWLKGELKEMMQDLLAPSIIKKRGYFNNSYIEKIINDHLKGQAYNANQLWQLLALELWHQKFIN